MAQPELVKDIEARVKKSGDTMTGNLIGKYFQGTWLQTTSITDLGSSPSKIAVIRDDGWIYYRTPSELASDIGLTGNYILKSGDTMTGQLIFNNNTSNQNGYPSIKWGTIQSNTPFIGYATDQSDGTFIITSLKGTTYATGLAIGGSSQNLLYKGQIVLNASNFNQYAPSLTGSGASGTWSININGNASTATTATNATNVNIANDTSSKIYVLGATTTGNTRIYRESSVYMSSNVLYGAAWNDYAEYRSSDPIEPGRVICETGNGTLKLSTERLQPGANVVSDTFGFAIGETENCKTPIAVSGRALVYTYEDRYSYNAGDPVCAGPGGAVSKMSREEVMMYPDRIVGIVSEIPEYEHWGTGNIEVKNRIWIKVK